MARQTLLGQKPTRWHPRTSLQMSSPMKDCCFSLPAHLSPTFLWEITPFLSAPVPLLPLILVGVAMGPRPANYSGTDIRTLIGPSIANQRPSLGNSILTLTDPSWLQDWALGGCGLKLCAVVPLPAGKRLFPEEKRRPQPLTHPGLGI